MSKNEPTSLSDWEKVEQKKKEMAKRLAGKTATLKMVAKKYQPKERKAECQLARDVMYEAMEEYEEGNFTWDKMVAEITKSLLAIKK